MTTIQSIRSQAVAKNHPCLSKEAHGKFMRIHVPIAPLCNIQCRYCVRKFDCVNESRPGVTSRLLSVDEAIERVRLLAERDSRLSVVGVAGPGDPLANTSTLEFFRRLHDEFEGITACVSTNGLALPLYADALADAGVESITVTINAVTAETAERVYSKATYKGGPMTGRNAALLILENQWDGLARAIANGAVVKVNSVLIPGVNDHELEEVARRAGAMGAYTHNIIGMIPQGEFAHLAAPSCHDIYKVRTACEPHLQQMSHCTRCRSDAYGHLGEDRDADSDALMSLMGVEYCEMVG